MSRQVYSKEIESKGGKLEVILGYIRGEKGVVVEECLYSFTIHTSWGGKIACGSLGSLHDGRETRRCFLLCVLSLLRFSVEDEGGSCVFVEEGN